MPKGFTSITWLFRNNAAPRLELPGGESNYGKKHDDFQKEAKDGKNESIRNFAAQTLPTLQSHLNQARQMEQAVNQSSSNSNTGNRGYGGNSGGNTYPTNNRTNPGTTSGTGTSPSR